MRNPSTSTNTNVVMWPSVGMGHLIPFCSFATRLAQESGCSVTLILFDNFFHSHRACLHLSRLAKYPNIHLLPLPHQKKLSTDDDTAANKNSIEDHIIATCMSALPHVLQILESLRDYVLILDVFCVPAMQSVESLGIPWYLFFTSQVALLSLMLLTPHMEMGSWLTHGMQLRLPGLPPLSQENLPDSMLRRSGLPKEMAFFKGIAKARAILINTFHDLDTPALHALATEHGGLSVPPLYAIGPLLENESQSYNNENDCIRWLDRQPLGSVVFVSFGSAAALDKRQLNDIGDGLRQSGQRFLWVVRERSSDTASRCDAYFQDTANDGAGAGSAESACGRGLMVTSWAPQVAILRHRSTGGFVTHCGWNSAMESICCGVPMVAWPMFAEQKMNAVVMVEQYGVALRMGIGSDDGFVKKEEVARSVRELMQGDEGGKARRRVAQLKFKAAQAVACGGSSCDAISDALKHWQS